MERYEIDEFHKNIKKQLDEIKVGTIIVTTEHLSEFKLRDLKWWPTGKEVVKAHTVLIVLEVIFQEIDYESKDYDWKTYNQDVILKVINGNKICYLNLLSGYRRWEQTFIILKSED